jgi:hypothetical protein
MSDRGNVRAKLGIAALLIAVAYGLLSFMLFMERGFRDPFLYAAKFGIGLLAIVPIFFSGLFQLYMGWSTAVASVLLAGFCILDFRGADLLFGVTSVCAGASASYLLLRDSEVRTKRKEILRREWR